MATAFDANNALNLAETAAVNTVNADSWLGDTDHVATVHEKVRLARSEDDFFYYAHEMPAVGVLARGGPQDDKVTIGEFEEYVRLTFDVWAAGADFDAADQAAKQIVMRLRSLMRLQAFSPSVNAASTQLDGFLADGTIANEDYDFDYVAAEDGGWLANGVTTSLLILVSTS